MKRRIPAIVLVLAMFAYFAVGFFRSSSVTRIGCLILGLGCLALVGALVSTGKREDGSKLVSVELCDDPALREEHEKNGTVDFSLQFYDGRRKIVTVKDKSEQYHYYMGFVDSDKRA